MTVVQLGRGNLIAQHRIIAVVKYGGAASLRLKADAYARGLLVDTSGGHKMRSLIITDSHHVVVSSVSPAALETRLTEVELYDQAPDAIPSPVGLGMA